MPIKPRMHEREDVKFHQPCARNSEVKFAHGAKSYII